MAYDSNDIRFLFSCFRRGVSFSRVLTIGRTLIWVSPEELCKLATEYEIAIDLASATRILSEQSGYCEPLFKFLGAEQVRSLDVSAYEGASIIHNLNLPMDGDLNGHFTAVIDGGSLEHVFNLAQAFKTCLELTTVGGSFLSLAPANNFLGHGFHQMSPEFMFAALSPGNGFEIQRMLMHENRRNAEVYEVMNPRQYKSRVTLCNRAPVYVKTWAVRESAQPIFADFPQQPDWEALWKKSEPQKGSDSLKSRIRELVKRAFPRLLSEYQRIRIERSQETGFKLDCYKKSRF